MDGSLFPEILNHGYIMKPSECTSRYTSLCSTKYSLSYNSASDDVVKILSGNYSGTCHYCDVRIDRSALPTLRKGSSGSSVGYLQMKLNWFRNWGSGTYALLETDGSFGSLTETALKQYQAIKGLSSDGVCGPLTWAELDKMTTGYNFYYKRPNCRSYANTLVETSYGRKGYQESCTCDTGRYVIPVTSNNYCEIACDLQACTNGNSSTTPVCSTYTSCSVCNTSCNTTSNSCNPHQNHDCVTSCYGHTTYCPSNYDGNVITETKTGKDACPTYSACASCNASCYGYVACSVCDQTVYGSTCRQCDQTGYFMDEFYEDYM